MSYFQKYQKTIDPTQFANNYSQRPLITSDKPTNQKISESRQSYLKAFKKHYIQKLLENPLKNKNENTRVLKENRNENEAKRKQDNCSYLKVKEREHEKSRQRQKLRDGQHQGLTRSKIQNVVSNNDSLLQEMLYSSINQIEREVEAYGMSNDLVRQNKMLKNSLSKLKQLLKQKLEDALKKNREELSNMLEEYSMLTKKLLLDKQNLTKELQNSQNQITKEKEKVEIIQNQYENKIRLIVQQHGEKTQTTKQQIDEFFEIILQYEEQAQNENKEIEKWSNEVDRLRSEVQRLTSAVEQLEEENENLKNQRAQNSDSQFLSDAQNDHLEEKYAEKLQVLLGEIQKLQEDNAQMSMLIKNCKCSRININESINTHATVSLDKMANYYEKELEEAKQQFQKTEEALMQACRIKDQCIDRLNLVIEQLRKERYESVDRITDEVIVKKQSDYQ